MKLKITLDNKTYEVEVEAAESEVVAPPPRGYVAEPAPVLVPAAIMPTQSHPDGTVNEAKVCRSPISGIVVKVAAQAGQSIQTGDILLVLEAMKMETNITAPTGGKIAAVKVSAGDGVQSGQVVVEFD